MNAIYVALFRSYTSVGYCLRCLVIDSRLWIFPTCLRAHFDSTLWRFVHKMKEVSVAGADFNCSYEALEGL